MIEAYKIGASLLLESNAIAEITKIAEEFESFERLVKSAQANVRAFAKSLDMIGAGARPINQLVTSLKKLADTRVSPNATGMQQVADISEKIATQQTTIARASSETATAWKAAADAMKGAGRTGGPGAPPGPTDEENPPGGGRRGPRRDRDAIGGDMFMAGLGLSQAGGGLLSFVEKGFNAAAEIGAQQARLTMMGYTEGQIREALGLGRQLQQQVPGTTIAANLETLADVTSVFQKPDEAMALLPDLARMGIVLGAAGKGDQIKELFAAARAGELRGSLSNPDTGELDTAKFAEFLKKLETVTVLTGGRVGPADYTAFLQQAGVGGVRLSDEALFAELPAIMMAMKAIKAGTAINSFNQTEFGRLFKPYGEEQERIGLVAPGGFGMGSGSSGGAGTIKPGALAGHDLAQSDPGRWAYEVLIPKLEAAGFKDMNSQLTELYRLFPRATITRIYEDIIRNKALIENYQHAIDAGSTPGSPAAQAFDIQEKVNPQLQRKAFDAAMTGFFSALGEAAMGPATQMLRDLTGGLNALANVAKEYPTGAKWMMETAAALGVVGVTLGNLASTVFFAAVTLKAAQGLLGIGGSAVAGAAGGAGVAEGAAITVGTMTVGTLALGAAAIGAILALLKIGSDHETPATEKAREDLRKQMAPVAPVNMVPQDGYDVEGRPIRLLAPSATTPDRGAAKPLQAEVTPENARSTAAMIADAISRALEPMGRLPSEMSSAVTAALSNIGIHIDGKEVASAVTTRLAGPRMPRMPDGTTGYNTRDSLTPPGLSVPY